MSVVDPRVIRSEQHGEVGSLLSANVAIIVDRWSHRAAEEQPRANRVHHDILLDHLTELLQKLGQSLTESEPADTCQHCPVATLHGEQRWDAGWSLPEVVRDFQILRLVIFEFLEESLPRPLGHREILAIGLALDESISASVFAYVTDREDHRLQTEKKRRDELKEVQLRLQAHADALQEADNRKNDFLALLAHELRNPLAPVRNALHVLRLKETPDPELQWAREVIERQSQQMARMVDDLFDISRIARGKVRVEKEMVAVASIVERAIEEVRPLADGRKHALMVTIPPEPIWLEADRRRLIQVLVNLLVNAVKYTNEGGKLELNVVRESDEVVFRIRDNGIGIPAELMARIFEPFIQEHQSEDRVGGGLGIGLALVRQLVDLHGGRVQAFSEGRGHGSEFVVHLPGVKPDRQAPVQVTDPTNLPTASARRILVVDDNRDAARSLAFLLNLYGHDVLTAHDGPTAIQNARTHVPEIVLLDIGMPQMDGFEVARRLRQDPALKDVLLVALTGYGQDRDRLRSHEAGFDVHLVKPVEFEHLNEILMMSGKPPDSKDTETAR